MTHPTGADMIRLWRWLCCLTGHVCLGEVEAHDLHRLPVGYALKRQERAA